MVSVSHSLLAVSATTARNVATAACVRAGARAHVTCAPDAILERLRHRDRRDFPQWSVKRDRSATEVLSIRRGHETGNPRDHLRAASIRRLASRLTASRRDRILPPVSYVRDVNWTDERADVGGNVTFRRNRGERERGFCTKVATARFDLSYLAKGPRCVPFTRSFATLLQFVSLSSNGSWSSKDSGSSVLCFLMSQ